jgi:hypothetical protein
MTTTTSAGGRADTDGRFGPVALLGAASIGAGALHAAAAATHGSTAAASVCFQALALAQLGWGAWAMVGSRRSILALGVLLSLGAVVGWVVVQSVGVGFISGLDDPHGIGWADGIAAALAAFAGLGGARRLLLGRARTIAPGPRLAPLRLAAIVTIAVVTLAGLAQSSSENHSHGEESATGHDHGAGTDDGPIGGGHSHGGASAVVPPVAYDPDATATSTGGGTTGARRVDLSGVPGVTPEQQARAERLVEVNLEKLPQWSDREADLAKGYRSIGDGFTGHEHLINWSYLDDGRTLDPDAPESLVFDTSGSTPKLVSAMYMLPPGSTLASAPDIGGALTQWHIHDNLCFTDSDAPRVVGLTDGDGECRPPTKKLNPVPMIHVWIVANPCGPFSALEGIAAGQVAAGTTQACDSSHGDIGS